MGDGVRFDGVSDALVVAVNASLVGPVHDVHDDEGKRRCTKIEQRVTMDGLEVSLDLGKCACGDGWRSVSAKTENRVQIWSMLTEINMQGGNKCSGRISLQAFRHDIIFNTEKDKLYYFSYPKVQKL